MIRLVEMRSIYLIRLERGGSLARISVANRYSLWLVGLGSRDISDASFISDILDSIEPFHMRVQMNTIPELVQSSNIMLNK